MYDTLGSNRDVPHDAARVEQSLSSKKMCRQISEGQNQAAHVWQTTTNKALHKSDALTP
jgi:hypothetical protein